MNTFLYLIFFIITFSWTQNFLYAQSTTGSSVVDILKSKNKALPIHTKTAVIYNLTIDYKTVNLTGKNVKAMLVNASLPAPTLFFKEGKKAIVYVTNKMDVETSIHWHGILLPNFQDGVPYLTTPPILPGKTHKFEFTLKQSGTYWYHSHTNLQEQRGIYGAIVVEPKKKQYQYDHDLVLVLSDWTNENPNEVLRTLKRGSEWYAIKKGSALSLSQVIARNALGAQLTMWRQRMPGMDISDVYYDAFLINGETKKHYDFKAGSKIRLRIINASASTYFWLSFGDKAPLLISADGINVKPRPVNKVLQAIAETYDFLITLPKKGHAIETRIMAQDGSGSATAIIGTGKRNGKGKVLKAPIIPKPDPVQEMKKMADMHREDKHHNMHHQGDRHHNKQNHSLHNKHKKHNGRTTQSATHSHHQQHKHSSHQKHKDSSHQQHKHSSHQKHKTLTGFSYDNLKALQKTSFPKTNTLKNIHFNLTGNMWRYVWSMNGRVLSKADIIKIKKGETVRIHLHNTTMMHHPMHLHGHFFRVLNKHEEYSPLKHTVDIPPMQTVTIEFDPDEQGDWMFHCHVLYHMKSGMSRIFRNNIFKELAEQPQKIPKNNIFTEQTKKISKNNIFTEQAKKISKNNIFTEQTKKISKNNIFTEQAKKIPKNKSKRDPRLGDYPISTILNMDNHWHKWAEVNIMSNRLDVIAVTSNTKNKVMLEGSFSWVDDYYNIHKNIELEMSYEYFTSDFFRFYAGGEAENTQEGHVNVQDMDIKGKLGFRYLLPYFIEWDMSFNHKAQAQIALEYELLLFPRTELFAEWEWTVDFGFVNSLPEDKVWEHKSEWSLGLNYMMSKSFSIIVSYSNHFSYGAGLKILL